MRLNDTAFERLRCGSDPVLWAPQRLRLRLPEESSEQAAVHARIQG
jgi:hypothetical protein